jgi:hypothetical protein
MPQLQSVNDLARTVLADFDGQLRFTHEVGFWLAGEDPRLVPTPDVIAATRKHSSDDGIGTAARSCLRSMVAVGPALCPLTSEAA